MIAPSSSDRSAQNVRWNSAILMERSGPPAAPGASYGVGTFVVASALLGSGDFQQAAERIDSIESSGIAGFPGDCRVHRAELLRGLGRPDEAEAEAEAARSEVQGLLHAGIAHYELGMIHLARGALEQSNRSFLHAAACGARVEPGLALLRLAEGNADEAVRLIDGALLSAESDPVSLSRLLPASIQIADAAGEPGFASRRMRDLQDRAGRFGPLRVSS